jgi:hypothetical protein
MGWLERLHKSWVLRGYVRLGGKLLVQRYGFAESYSGARVKVALERSHSNLRYLAHACAMFCSRDEFLTWMESLEPPVRERLADPYRTSAHPALVAASHRQYIALYEALRHEVARLNGGSLRFLPEPPPAPLAWSPVTNDIATGMRVPF